MPALVLPGGPQPPLSHCVGDAELLAVTVRSNGIAGAVLNQYVYAYDKAGNRSSEQIDQGVSAATHNNLNQLISLASSGGPMRFRGSLSEIGTVTVEGSSASFDTRNSNFVGSAQMSTGTNVVSVVAMDYSANKATNWHQVVATNKNGSALAYDQNGNLTNAATVSTTNTYDWDGANRLVAFEVRAIGQSTKRTEFTYDGYGRCVRITGKTNSIIESDNTYVWSRMTLSERRDATGAVAQRRYFAQGEQLAGAAYFYTRDHLKSVREFTDEMQLVGARYSYDPFGRKSSSGSSLQPDFAFTGHFLPFDSGPYLALYRSYDSSTGRWLSRDPLAEAAGFNLYPYSENDPLNKFDPDGRFALFAYVALAVVVAAVLLYTSSQFDVNRSMAKAAPENSGTIGQGWVASCASKTADVAGQLQQLGASTTLQPPGPITELPDAINFWGNLGTEPVLNFLHSSSQAIRNWWNNSSSDHSSGTMPLIYIGPHIPDDALSNQNQYKR